MEHKERKYLCFWGEGYVIGSKALMETHQISWFTGDLGYTPENIASIMGLNLGESINLRDMLTEHSIVRVL